MCEMFESVYEQQGKSKNRYDCNRTPSFLQKKKKKKKKSNF